MKKTVLSLALCLIALTTFAALPDYSEGILDREAALAVAADVNAERFPDANQVMVASMRRITYETDGTYEEWHEAYVRVLTEEGRRANTTVSSYFTIPYQRGPEDCRVSLVEIVKPDGKTERIDVEAQSRIMVNPSSMSQNIYNPNSKLIRVNVPGLEVGDVLHLVMFDRIVQPRMADTWSDWITFEGGNPILHSVVEIDGPVAMPLRSIALKAEIPGTVTATTDERDGRIHYRWEARDIPRMFPEPRMPAAHTVVQRLLVSTIPDWETVSRWYWDLSKPHFDATPAMEQKVAELTEGKTATLDKIHALFRFVSQEIRYMGITVEATAPGYEPHDVKDTFEARHGVCRDKAALLVVMLRLAGVDAFPTLIHAGPRKDKEVPQPYFNHAIVAALGDDGDYVLMDPTDETTKELFPAYLNFLSYLVARPEGETLRTSPIDPAEINMQGIETQARVGADGVLTAETVLDFKGINDNAYRGYFARIKPEDRRHFIEGLVRGRLPGARITDLSITPADMMDTSTSMTVRVSYEAPDIRIRGDEATMLPLPIFGNSVGMARRILGTAGLRERRFPLVTDITCGVRETLALNLDPSLGTLASLPYDAPIKNDAFTWRMGYTPTPGGLEITGDLRLNVVEFSTNQYQELRQGLERIEVALRKMPVLSHEAADTSGADVQVLSDSLSVVLDDAQAWTETREVAQRVLTYAGIKKFSEIKLHYNPAWEDARVEDVVVTGVDGSTNTISAKEINIMDAPWSGAAPRYPAGKTLVASLPAVEIGSVIRYRVVREKRQRPFFAATRSFNSMNPMDRVVLSVDVPAGSPLHVQADSFRGQASSELVTAGPDGARAIMTWSDTDVARVEREDLLPPWWSFNPSVFVSTGNWRDYARQVSAVLAGATRKQRDAERLARTLVDGEKDPWTRVRLVRDYVATHIRGAGPSLPALPLTAVSQADTVLDDGYGNTTDRAVLLLVMLRAIGLEPDVVLVSGLPDLPALRQVVEQHPQTGTFPTVLVRLGDSKLKLEDGEFIYLNDTDQYAVIGACAHEGKLALDLTDGSIAAVTPCRPSRTEQYHRLAVEADGAVTLTRTTAYHGLAFGGQNKRYAEMTPEERDRHFQELVTAIAQSATAEGDLVTDFSGHPGTVSVTVRVPDYAIVSAQQLYFEMPDSLAGLLRLRTSQRANPVYRSSSLVYNSAVDVEFPDGYEVAIAPASWQTRDVGQLDLAIELEQGEAGRLRYEARAEAAPVIMSPSHYQALQDVDKRLSHERARMVLLTTDEVRPEDK